MDLQPVQLDFFFASQIPILYCWAPHTRSGFPRVHLQVYSLVNGRRDVEAVYSMGIMEDVNLVPQPAGGQDDNNRSLGSKSPHHRISASLEEKVYSSVMTRLVDWSDSWQGVRIKGY